MSVFTRISDRGLGLFLYEYWSRIYFAKKYPPPGQLVDIGDSHFESFRQRKLDLYCEGEGDVTVVLEDGLGPIGSLVVCGVS